MIPHERSLGPTHSPVTPYKVNLEVRWRRMHTERIEYPRDQGRASAAAEESRGRPFFCPECRRMLAKVYGEVFVVKVGPAGLRGPVGTECWCAKCQDWRLVA